MPYLALDTSAGLAVAVVDGSTVTRGADPQPRRHAEQLAPCISTTLGEAGLSVRDLTGVVVGTGPAPFTGLRAGLVTARTLGHVLGIPVLGVASLSAVALQCFELSDVPQEVVVVTDARRHEVYWARYGRDGGLGVRLVAGPGVARPADVPTRGAALAGRGVALLGGSYDDSLAALDPDPVALWAVATAMCAHGEPTPVEPLYLRRPDAVPAAGAKKVGR